MTKTVQFLKMTLLGGVLFLVPIVVLVIVLAKAFKAVGTPIHATAEAIAGPNIGPTLAKILVVAILLALCFAAGLASRTLLARRTVGALEAGILSKLPGYELIKAAGENMVGLENDRTRNVVLARVEDAWQIGFLVEDIDEDHAAINIPNVPSPWSGSLYIMTRDRFRHTDITLADAIACLKRGGLGTKELFGGKVPSFA